MENLNIPTGYTHRHELIERGWSASLINEHLTDVVKIDAPEGISNKAYSNEEIARVENSVAAVRKVVEAVRYLVPRNGPYTQENTISRAALISRGWTPAHINRLLGAPDATSFGVRGESYRYGLDRVEWAEGNDAKLVKRLAPINARKEEKIARLTAKEGQIIYRKIDGEWCLQGAGLIEGNVVTVTKKDGSSSEETVGQILTDTNGILTAKIGRKPRKLAPRQPRYVEEFEEYFEKPKASGAWDKTAVTAEDVREGDVMRHGEQIVKVTSAFKHHISPDDPSIYGSHLLGHEFDLGTKFTFREATAEEAKPLLDHEAWEQAEQKRLMREMATKRKLEALARAGEYPKDAYDITDSLPEPVYDSRNIYGSGEALFITDTHLILVEKHGMDGDNWAQNNTPGQRLWLTPITEKIREYIKILEEK